MSVDSEATESSGSAGDAGQAAASTWATLRVLIGGRRSRVAALVFTGLLAGLAEAGILALVAEVASDLVTGAHQLTVSVGPLHLTATVGAALIVAAVLALVRIGLGVVIAYLPARIAADLSTRMRNQLFDAYSRASWDLQAAERDGALQELLTNQVVQATLGVLMAAGLISAVLTFFTLLAAALALSPVAALVVLVVAFALFGLLSPLGRVGRHHGRRLSTAQLDYGTSVGESVRLAEEIFTFGIADVARARVQERVNVSRWHFFVRAFIGAVAGNLYQGLVFLLLVGGLAGLFLVGTAHVAALGAVVLMLIRSASYGQRAQTSWQQLQQVAPFIDRHFAAEARYREAAAEYGDQPFAPGAELRFDSVSFGYAANAPVLTDVSFTIGPGEAVGISGPSGVGKSTLVQLLLRMRAPTAGRFLLGDVPADQVAPDEWRRHMAYVAQEPRLMHATVADNIRFFRDIDDHAVERAARLAHIHDDIAAMPSGYQTIVGQRADAVSGGQRQRICLARALAGRPTVLVLDEPTSALDLASEAEIQESLSTLRGTVTIVVVTHRPSLLELCDRVLHVQGGTVQMPVPVVPAPSG